MLCEANDCPSLLLILNLSPLLRSSDLRIIFHTFIQNGAFNCFHYRHRSCTVEFLKNYSIFTNFAPNTKLCFVSIKNSEKENFIKDLKFFIIKKLKINILCIDEIYRTFDKKVKDQFDTLQELTPPSYLPYGNVGTPTEVIHNLISQCKIPTSVLRSLKFDTIETFKNVGFNYETLGENTISKNSPHSSDCEDWERHIQLHDDVDSQQRTGERAYECEKEIVWEKGSSGLVHYTDVLYWNEKAGKNVFDEDTVDDWDIDMSIYTDPSVADRDARELLLMREIEAARKEKDICPTAFSISKNKPASSNHIFYASFEKHTKGFGSEQLSKYGWEKGKPIGTRGLIEPIQDSSRNPHDKTGLGYCERSQKVFKKHTKDQEFLIYVIHFSKIKISTIYDHVEEEDDNNSLQSAEPTLMKYREPKPKRR
ncbi:hypothetical protein HZS_3582 [Henneguya salminicola]|nr:hypothetical protein HZS_3582 [Henneguya salminicola]